MFERNLHRDEALLLRRAVAPLFGYDPEEIGVRDLAVEAKAAGDKRPDARLQPTREILREMGRGDRVPEIVIQPQLSLMVGRGMKISPDFMIYDRERGIYVPGEEKSQILRQGVGEPVDLDRARRQAAVQILALREELVPLGLSGRVTNRAVLVFASPYGLSPAPAAEERMLDAEVHELERAVRTLNDVAEKSGDLPDPEDAGGALLDLLKTNYQDSCLGSCVMARVCKSRCAGRAQLLGSAAADLLGPDTSIERVIAVRHGAAPASEREAAIAAMWDEAEPLLGFGALGRRMA
jgi:hypothetical protein